MTSVLYYQVRMQLRDEETKFEQHEYELGPLIFQFISTS